MENSFWSSPFARLFVWMTKAKLMMGIFFVVFVILYLLFGFVSVEPAVELNFLTAVEMLFAAFFIGLSRQAIMREENPKGVRCCLWVAVGTLVTLLFSLVFKWFSSFPGWCFYVFIAFTVFSMAAVVLGDYIELHRETRRLNSGLKQFQMNPAKKESCNEKEGV